MKMGQAVARIGRRPCGCILGPDAGSVARNAVPQYQQDAEHHRHWHHPGTPDSERQSRRLVWRGGIGTHLLSELYDNGGRQLSTAFQFGDHIGVGYVTADGMDIGLLIQHFSNGSIKQPNDGVNFAVVRMAYPF